MKIPTPRLVAAALLAVAAAGRTPVGAQAPRADTAAATSTAPGPAAADVRFMRGMMAHHAQALAMTALVPTRSTRADVRLLAERIEVSQRDEIAIMRSWLADRGVAVPAGAGSAHAGHHAREHGAAGHDAHADGAGHAMMPGMLTDAELARLAQARGAEFDRLFLTFMIRHHEGALVMVADFFATPGAGQEPQLFGFASDVDADQRAEIRRMRALLAAPSAVVPASTPSPSSRP